MQNPCCQAIRQAIRWRELRAAVGRPPSTQPPVLGHIPNPMIRIRGPGSRTLATRPERPLNLSSRAEAARRAAGVEGSGWELTAARFRRLGRCIARGRLTRSVGHGDGLSGRELRFLNCLRRAGGHSSFLIPHSSFLFRRPFPCARPFFTALASGLIPTGTNCSCIASRSTRTNRTSMASPNRHTRPFRSPKSR
jgi:hypothetical protein